MHDGITASAAAFSGQIEKWAISMDFITFPVFRSKRYFFPLIDSNVKVTLLGTSRILLFFLLFSPSSSHAATRPSSCKYHHHGGISLLSVTHLSCWHHHSHTTKSRTLILSTHRPDYKRSPPRQSVSLRSSLSVMLSTLFTFRVFLIYLLHVHLTSCVTYELPEIPPCEVVFPKQGEQLQSGARFYSLLVCHLTDEVEDHLNQLNRQFSINIKVGADFTFLVLCFIILNLVRCDHLSCLHDSLGPVVGSRDDAVPGGHGTPSSDIVCN
mmetsp:Transcript_14378/g.26908  ORF Transcript_14378/g.26908 Transcript_14378/m.26908 type:complete len:268 (-) Transcript_14378:3692-4495(-)